MDALERYHLDAGVLMKDTTGTAGFTLVEVMIAVVILSIVVLSVPRVGLDFSRTVSGSRVRNEANALANAWNNAIRARQREQPLGVDGFVVHRQYEHAQIRHFGMHLSD